MLVSHNWRTEHISRMNVAPPTAQNKQMDSSIREGKRGPLQCFETAVLLREQKCPITKQCHTQGHIIPRAGKGADCPDLALTMNASSAAAGDEESQQSSQICINVTQ